MPNNTDLTYASRPTSLDQALRVLEDALVNKRQVEGEEKAIAEIKRDSDLSIDRMMTKVNHLKGVGLEHAHHLRLLIETNVRVNPRPILGGVALSALAFGLLLGRRRKLRNFRGENS